MKKKEKGEGKYQGTVSAWTVKRQSERENEGEQKIDSKEQINEERKRKDDTENEKRERVIETKRVT